MKAEKKNILEIRDLHKEFYIGGQKLEVLAGVDLTVKKVNWWRLLVPVGVVKVLY